MTITNLNIFQSGTLASVAPVNENFETLRVAVNATEQSVTANRTYLDNKLAEVNTSISNTIDNAKLSGNVFCVNSGNLDEYENPAVLNISGTTLSFDTPFTATNINGNTITVTSLADISISGYEDGTYNVFVDLNSNVEIIKNAIYRQPNKPENIVNTVWLNTNKNPLTAKRYTSDGWEDFLKIPIGYFVIEEGTVTKVVTNPYNQNGYNINSTCEFLLPDYTKGVNKTNDVDYTAEVSGWIYAYYESIGGVSAAHLAIDGQSFTVSSMSFTGYFFGTGNAILMPVSKGSVYRGNALTKFVFFPNKTL